MLLYSVWAYLAGIGCVYAVAGPTILWYGFGPGSMDGRSRRLARVVFPSILLVGGAVAFWLLKAVGVLP